MGRNYFNKFKKPLLPSLIKPVKALTKKVGSDIRHSVNEVKDSIVQHPVESIIMGASLVGGAAAVCLSGGLAAPEVAVGLAEEESVLIGTEIGANAIVDSALTTEASEFVAVNGANLVGDESALVVGSEELPAMFESVEVGATEPELSSFTQAQNVLENPELEEQIVNIESKPVQEVEEIFVEPEEIPQDHPLKQVLDDENVIIDESGKPTDFGEELDPQEEAGQLIKKEVNINEPISEVNPEADALEYQGQKPQNLKGDLDFNNSIDDLLNEEDLLDLDRSMDADELNDLLEADELAEFNELQIARNEEEVAKAFARKPTLFQQVIQKGKAGIKLINKISDKLAKLGGVSAGVGVIIGAVGELKDEKTLKGKLNKIKEIFGHIKNLGGKIKGLNESVGEGNGSGGKIAVKVEEKKELQDSNKGFDELNEGVGVINEGITALNNLAQINHKNRTHNDTLKQNVKQNKGEMEQVKGSSTILDNSLQAVVNIEKKEDDDLNNIKNILDRPRNPSDFITALKNYNTRDSKIDFIAENYETFSNFNQNDIDIILGFVV